MPKLTQVRKTSYRITEPLVSLMKRAHLTPNAVTGIGFAIAVGGVILIATGHLLIAGFLVLIAGFFDMLDGTLARRTKRVTVFGAVLDSIFDRLSEALLLLGILIFYLTSASPPMLGILFVGLALVASPLVSYVRAKAEIIGLECKIGIFTRAERVIVLAIGLWLSHLDYALIIALGVIAAFSFISTGQRLHYIRQQTKRASS